MILMRCIFLVSLTAVLCLLPLTYAEHHHHHHEHDHDHAHADSHPLITRLTTTLRTTLTSLLAPLHTLHPQTAALTASIITSSIPLLSLPLLPLRAHLHHLHPFAAGALLSDLLNHLPPTQQPLLLSLFLFALLDALLRRSKASSAAALNLFADALHNFCDGLSLGAAFLHSTSSGISLTVAIALHELPQEVADYALLLREGYTSLQALFANLLCANTAFLGTALALWLGQEGHAALVSPFAAGGLLYLTFCSIIPDVVADVAAPVEVDGKKVPVPLNRFFVRVAVAAVMATAGVAVVALVEVPHAH